MPAARPPSDDPLVALADRCVQCGLCLPVCPTYRHDALEAESPRGRIALVRAWAVGTVEPTAVGDRHLDHCLGCRACEAVCPAGVQYGDLLAGARARQAKRRNVGPQARLAGWLAAHPRVFSRLLALYRRAFPALPGRWRRLPRPPAPCALSNASRARARAAHGTAPAHETAQLFTGCVARAYEPPVREALAALCDAAGVRLVEPAGQGCCGALHTHAGDRAQADRLAARNRIAFTGAGPVLSLASGCHEALASALPADATATDAIAFLDARRDRLAFRAQPERVALHVPCTQRNLVRSLPALRRLLARVPGLEIIELDAGFGCCGAAGTGMLTDPERAADFRRPLLEQFGASGASRLLSANIGCRLHLAMGTSAPVQHPLELLAEALAAPVPPAHAPAVDCAP